MDEARLETAQRAGGLHCDHSIVRRLRMRRMVHVHVHVHVHVRACRV